MSEWQFCSKDSELMIPFKKIAKKLKRLIRNQGNQEKSLFSKKSYSQCGEDIIIDHLLGAYLKIEKPSYLDIGAYHPFHYSNTAYFYKKGCHGVCVEPDPFLFEEIQKKRNKDICLNAGVASSTADFADFYILSSKTLNTFSKAEAERYESFGQQKIKKIIKIPLITINQIIEKYFPGCPDFISIDVEGLDLEIIKSFDFQKYRPAVFCIETLTYAEDTSERKIFEIIHFMEEQNYILYGDTHINSIFVERKRWDKR